MRKKIPHFSLSLSLKQVWENVPEIGTIGYHYSSDTEKIRNEEKEAEEIQLGLMMRTKIEFYME